MPMVPLVREITLFHEILMALQQNHKDRLDMWVQRGVVTLVPRLTEVRVSGPGTVDWMCIVSPVTGEFKDIVGCVPNVWLKDTPPSSPDISLFLPMTVARR
jgi:hypothetical protein